MNELNPPHGAPTLVYRVRLELRGGGRLELTAAMPAAFVVLALFRELPLCFALRPLARLPFVSLKWTEAAAVSFAHGLAAPRWTGGSERIVTLGNGN